MIRTETRNQRTLEIDFAQGGYLAIAAESFLTDRKASGLTLQSVEFYAFRLKDFIRYCDGQAVTLVQDITPDFLRRYLLALAEGHNAGGVHAAFRTLRAFLRWLEAEEVMPPEWKNPIRKVKPPKLPTEPLKPVSLDDVAALLASCTQGDNAERDRALFLFLLDTGIRARELCNVNLEDVEFGAGAVLIRQGKGRKPRTVFIGRKTRRALRSYLRTRRDNSPALFVTVEGDRLSYNGLREILRRRARDAGLKDEPTLHQFRRAFALNMLRNGADIFSLQRLMGHSDLSVLRRYLAQTDQDGQAAHLRAGPVDRM